MNGKTGVRLLLIGTTIDITTKASRTSRRRKSTAASICNFIAFVSVRSTSFGSSIPNDLFVGDHARHHFPTRFGSIDRSRPNKNQKNHKEIRGFINKSVSKVLTRSGIRVL